MDSGATDHVTATYNNFNQKVDYKGKGKLTIGNGSQLAIEHVGSSSFHSHKPLNLHNILHVPEITKNLLSISRFTCDNDVNVEFTCDACFVKDRTT